MKTRMTRLAGFKHAQWFFNKQDLLLLGGSGPETNHTQVRSALQARSRVAKPSKVRRLVLFHLWREPDEPDLTSQEWLSVAVRLMARIGVQEVPWWAYLGLETRYCAIEAERRAMLSILAYLVRPDGIQVGATRRSLGRLNSDGSKPEWRG